MALFPTDPTLMLFYQSLIAMAYPYHSTCSSVVTFFPTDPTRESPINHGILEFWTVVSPMPFTSTVFAVEFYSCIWRGTESQWLWISTMSTSNEVTGAGVWKLPFMAMLLFCRFIGSLKKAFIVLEVCLLAATVPLAFCIHWSKYSLCRTFSVPKF